MISGRKRNPTSVITCPFCSKLVGIEAFELSYVKKKKGSV